MPLTELSRIQILELDQSEICGQLSGAEVVYIFKQADGFWSFDYRAADQGRAGYHAEMPSGLCADGFFFSKPVLDRENLCQIMAEQLWIRYRALSRRRPTRVIGIPNGANRLAKELARQQELDCSELIKTGNSFTLKEPIGSGEILLFLEDFCRGATNLSDGISAVMTEAPKCELTDFQMVILNCGGRSTVEALGKTFGLGSLSTHKSNQWRPANCPLCRMGSKRIGPKESEENWRLLVTGQLA